MHTWQPTILLAGVDVTARVVGEMYRRQEESAAHVCTLTLLAATANLESEREAAEGATLVITMAWDGGTAKPWFSGRVQQAPPDWAVGTLAITATDGLQEWAEAQTEAAIDAAVTGSARCAAVQGARTNGWDQLLAALKTVQSGYAIGRDGVHRCTPWAPGAAALVLTAASILEDGIKPAAGSVRDRTNTVRYTAEVRAPILYEALITAGFGVGQTFCEWYARPWVPIPCDSVLQAATGAGPIYRPQGVVSIGSGASDAGITFTRFPESQQINCGDAPVEWRGGANICMAAAWKWSLPWAQTCTWAYTIVLTAPDSVAAYGAQIDERRASVSTEDSYSDWGSGASAGRPAGDWDTTHGVSRLITIDAAAETDVILSILAEGTATIIGAHRDSVLVDVLPWVVQDLDLHHSAGVSCAPFSLTAKVAAIECRYRLDDWSASTVLTLRRRRGPTGTVEATPLNQPERPAVPDEWSLGLTVTFPVRFGGDTESTAWDETWRGVSTNYYEVAEGAPVYPYRCTFERPAVPDAARDAITAAGTASYTVSIPRD